jgi:predicted pore-forming effector associated with SMODS systems
MVTCDVDTDPQPPIYVGVAFASIFGASLVTNTLKYLVKYLEKVLPPFVAPSVTPFVIFGILLWLFNRYLWRWPLIRRVSGIPDLEGTWKGTLSRTTSANATQSEIQNHKAECYITQTWRKIDFVFADFVKSEEPTRVATARIVGMFVENPQDIHVRYVYGARPTTLLRRLDDLDAMPSEGAAVLRLRDLGGGKWCLRGTYHSDKMRRGDIYLELEDSRRPREGAPPTPKSSP